MDAAVQLQHIFTARHLVQPINILCNNSGQLARSLQFSQLVVSSIGLCRNAYHFLTIKIIKLCGMTDKKAVTENGFRRVIKLLMIQSINRAKIGDPAFG